MQMRIVTALWRGPVGMLTVEWEVFGVNLADMNGGGICLLLVEAENS